MFATRQGSSQTALTMLEMAAHATRSGFACMFSSSDEYEAALIAERRAEGRYRRARFWPITMFVGCGLTVAGAVLMML